MFAALGRSEFRRKFRLSGKDLEYLRGRGLPTTLEHGRRFVAERLAAAAPHNDGKQTPYRGHPIFVAQHATACCCRKCLEKLHGIRRGHDLTVEEQEHVLSALERWLRSQLE